MKKILIVVISLLIIIASFIGYRGYLFNKYKVELNHNLESIDFNRTIEIKKIEKDNEKIYSKYKNINFLLNEEFIFNEENSNMSQTSGVGYNAYYLNYKGGNEYDAQIRIGNNFNIYDSLINASYEIYSSEDTNIGDIDIKELFMINSIKSNKDLYYAVFSESNKKIDIMSSKKELQYIYLLRTLSNTILVEGDYYFIEGDLSGYIINIKNKVYEAHLYMDSEEYVISFWNNKEQYFKLENIQEFLSNIN